MIDFYNPEYGVSRRRHLAWAAVAAAALGMIFMQPAEAGPPAPPKPPAVQPTTATADADASASAKSTAGASNALNLKLANDLDVNVSPTVSNMAGGGTGGDASQMQSQSQLQSVKSDSGANTNVSSGSTYVFPAPAWAANPVGGQNCIVNSSRAIAVGWNFVSHAKANQMSDRICSNLAMGMTAYAHCQYQTAAYIRAVTFAELNPGAEPIKVRSDEVNMTAAECRAAHAPPPPAEKVRIERVEVPVVVEKYVPFAVPAPPAPAPKKAKPRRPRHECWKPEPKVKTCRAALL